MKSLLRAILLLAAFAIPLTLQASCARSVDSEGDANPLLVSPGANNPAPLTACVSTDCPPPWATCSPGGLCTTDTSRDIDHCGSCRTACPKPAPSFHATSVCSDGKCVYACDELSADCNKSPTDGCEVFTGDDPKNCGGCGLECKDGEICWRGACGCPNGFTLCGTECKNLQVDDYSCGVCNKECEAPPWSDPEWLCGPGIQPLNSTWACMGGGCKMACQTFFDDCNDELCSDGCETDVKSDPLNCGACGKACAANQDCVDGACLCPPGTTRCGKRCVDVNVDPNNCGECGNGCPGAAGNSDNGAPNCRGGSCSYLCYAGFADCDGRIENGCEANIGTDPLNCGGCGTKCDAARSQPCVLGKCLTKPCTDGPGTF